MLNILIWLVMPLLLAGCFDSSPPPAPTPPVQSGTTWQITGNHDGQPVIIKANAIHGGAIYSLIWAGTEFIDSSDNGRELQTAWTMNVPGETENPTEAGAGADGSPATKSTTVVLVASDTNNTIRTEAQLAYWLPFRGETLSPHKKAKTVALGYQGLTNVLHHQITITVATAAQALNVEGLTSYSPKTFRRFFIYDLASRTVREIPPPQQMSYNSANPTIIANADLSRALALYGTSNLYHYGGAPGGTGVWWPKLVSNAYQTGPVKGGDTSWDAFTIFGTLNQVLDSLGKLSQSKKKMGPTVIRPSKTYDIDQFFGRKRWGTWIEFHRPSGVQVPPSAPGPHFGDLLPCRSEDVA